MLVPGVQTNDRAQSWVLVAAIVGSSMSFIDGSAVNVALPILQRDLHADSAQLQWVVEGYALFLSALILIGGSLGDRFGRRLLFAIGIALFASASLVCALAQNVEVLIAARCLQGCGGALATPGSLALISANFTGEARGRAIGTWSGFASITAAGGPVLGGWLAQTFSWRWVFLINVPLALVVLAICALRVPESRDEHASRSLDVSGALLATFGLGLAVFGLIRMQVVHSDAFAIGSLLVGVALLAAFVLYERRTKEPMLPPSLFASRSFTGANLYTFVLYAALGGSLYFLPFTLIDVQHYAPIAAGAAFLPFVFIQFFFSRWSGGLVARIGARTPLVIGALAAALGFALFALPGIGGSYWLTYFPASVALGIGGAFFVAPLTTVVLDSVGAGHAGVASGVNNAVARTAGLIAVAVLGIVLSTTFERIFDRRLAMASVGAQTRAYAREHRAEFAAGSVPPQIASVDRRATDDALRHGFLDGFRAVMIVAAIGCVLAAGIAARTISGKPLGPAAGISGGTAR